MIANDTTEYCRSNCGVCAMRSRRKMKERFDNMSVEDKEELQRIVDKMSDLFGR